MYTIIKELVLPPGSLVLILAVGVLALAAGWRRLGLCLALFGLLAFYLLSTPFVAGELARLVQAAEPLREEAIAGDPPQAIVVLSAGLLPRAPEYGASTVDEITMQRLAYAAFLWRQYKIPILVSGGQTPYAAATLADVMRDVLNRVFDVPVAWVEDKSVNTLENATFSAAMLREHGIVRVLLVTHAGHMPRAAQLFRMTGLRVISAPTAFGFPSRNFPDCILPRASAFQDSYYALYELLGGAWYGLRGIYAPQAL